MGWLEKTESCCRKRAKASEWDAVGETPAVSRWDATPARAEEGATPGRWDATPGGGGGANRWDATPTPGRDTGATPRKNRWDETPTPGRVSHCAQSSFSPDQALGSWTLRANPEACSSSTWGKRQLKRCFACLGREFSLAAMRIWPAEHDGGVA